MREKVIITKSWSGYTIPPKPGPPIPYSEAESLQAYSIFTFNDREQIIKFQKYLIHTTTYDTPSGFILQTESSRSFYRIPNNKNELPTPITLDQTLTLDSYIRIDKIESNAFKSYLIKKEIMFDHQYTYWSSGKLKSCTYKNSSEEGYVTGVDDYDECGSLINK